MKVFKKDHYHKLMGVDKEPTKPCLPCEEKAARDYANSADGNPIDEFTPMQKLLMKTAFLAGVKWARQNYKK